MHEVINLRICQTILTLILGLFLSVGAYAEHHCERACERCLGWRDRRSIVERNATNGTITDLDGNFSLNVQRLLWLFLSSVIKLRKWLRLPRIIVTLEDSELLDELLLWARYGRTKKDDLTGSVTAIKPDELSKGITNNAQDMLVGKVAGVDVITAGIDGQPVRRFTSAVLL